MPPDVPLFFLADRGDITARLDAVEAGGAGYFLKPVDLPLLLEALDECVLKPLHHRVLIVDDTLPSAREIARWLDSRGMVTQVLPQPLLILQALSNFQPSLLVMSLDLKETDGLALAQAVHQHELFRELPMALLSAQADIGPRLVSTGLSGEALLGKPLNPELLFAAIAKRLRQGSGLHRKLSQLSNRDTVSGLYNRPYFLAHLERALVATAANAQPVAIMLIALDNLRAVENQDVAAADEMIEQAARRLKNVLGSDPITARFGDAIFMVLLGFTTQDALLATAREVQTSLETDPYRLASGNTTVAHQHRHQHRQPHLARCRHSDPAGRPGQRHGAGQQGYPHSCPSCPDPRAGHGPFAAAAADGRGSRSGPAATDDPAVSTGRQPARRHHRAL